MWILHEFLSLSFLFLSVIRTDAIVVKPEHSLAGPYEAGAANLAWWDLTGSAQLAENVIRLTTDEEYKQGAIWNNYPVQSLDWELHMQFHIHGKGLHHNGDGMAIWYVRDPLHTGPVFGSKDYFSGLGVFIDTYEDQAAPHNHRHPYVSAVVNNGSFHYEHDEYGTSGQVGGCHIPLRNLEWPTKIAVSYINNILAVFIDAYGNEQWMECFRSHEIYLPTGYHFGISASTGDLSDNHDIVLINGLDMNLPDKEWEDKSHIIPYAGFLELPIKSRQEPVVDFVKNEVKREVKEEPIHHEPQPKVEEAPEVTKASTPLYQKAIYIIGIGVIIYVAVCTFKSYSAQRKERMQKRLY